MGDLSKQGVHLGEPGKVVGRGGGGGSGVGFKDLESFCYVVHFST